MGLIHFATDDTRHEIVLPSHRITAAEPCPSDDEHALIVIDSGQTYHVCESLESVAAKLHAHGVEFSVAIPVACEPDDDEQDDSHEPAAEQSQPVEQETSTETTATPEAQPAAEGAASQPVAAGTES